MIPCDVVLFIIPLTSIVPNQLVDIQDRQQKLYIVLSKEQVKLGYFKIYLDKYLAIFVSLSIQQCKIEMRLNAHGIISINY